MSGTFLLGLTFVGSKRRNGTRFLIGNLDLSVLALITHDILLQGSKQAFGMLRGEDDTTFHVGFWNAGQYAGKVKHKVA